MVLKCERTDETFKADSTEITLKNIKPHSDNKILIPHSSPAPGAAVVASISMEYTTSGGKTRRGTVMRSISTALPVQVSVMDSFRNKTYVLISFYRTKIDCKNRLLSKFTISSTGPLQVRVRDAKLEGGSGLKISATNPGKGRIPIVRFLSVIYIRF